MRKLILDVDGVLAKFHERALTIIRDRWGYTYELDHFKEWDVTLLLPLQEQRDELNATIQLPGFASELEPYTEAQRAVRELREREVHLLFATSPNHHSPTWMWERKIWLMQHFGASEEEIAHIHRKYFLAADAFVDDKPSHVRSWAQHNPGGTGVLWDAVYNRGAAGLRRCSDWSEILSMFQ